MRFLPLFAVFLIFPAGLQAAEKSSFDLFAVIDADASGDLTAQEAQANAGVYFDKIDLDHNQVITLDELKARAAAVEASRGGDPVLLADRIAASAARHLKAIDTDGDGQVIRSEYLARALERHAAMDADHDGHVTRAEFSAPRLKVDPAQASAPASTPAP